MALRTGRTPAPCPTTEFKRDQTRPSVTMNATPSSCCHSLRILNEGLFSSYRSATSSSSENNQAQSASGAVRGEGVDVDAAGTRRELHAPRQFETSGLVIVRPPQPWCVP